MAGSHWGRVKAVLAAALEEEDRARRAALLDEACADDLPLRAEVESLLAAEAAAGTFIERPALAGLRRDEEPEPNVGRVLGPYLLEQCIGRGGMGAVYLARRTDHEFERRVAIKMIRRGMDSELVIRRFRHERQILASLDHPHIARLFDGGTTPDGLPYFVMEYVAGTPIDRYADEHCLGTAARIGLCLGVVDAVQHAHDQHVVHRDLKPSNVLVTADGHAKLLDFGIAKILDPDVRGDSTLTSLARPMTPDYASPEQVRGEPVTPSTDVYALGLLLYELLTGRRPYRLTTRTPEEIVRVVCETDPERPSAIVGQVDNALDLRGHGNEGDAQDVSRTRDGSPELLRQRLSGAVDEIVLKALRKEPNQRYQTAAALASDLRRYLAEQPVSAGRGAMRYRTRRLLHRHRAGLGIAAAVIGAVAITGLVVRSGAPPVSTEVRSSQVTPRPSVAVVAFRNLSEHPSDRWLSTALAEMLTTELGGDGQVRVLPPDRVAQAESDVRASRSGTLSRALLEQLRTTLGASYLLVGTFAITEQSSSRGLRIDVTVHRQAEDPLAVAGVGDEARLFSVIADAGRELRRHLGLKATSPEATSAARAAFPTGLDATRLYAEGTARLRLLDAVAARDLLEQAAAREPGNALIQTALASAWTSLGYDRLAADAAQRAFDASGGLTREDRLNVEGRLHEAQQHWAKAIDVYRTLWGFFSDNAEYGLRLARAQTSAGEARETLATLDAIRRLPASQSADPRIDLAEAQAASSLGDFRHELAALQRTIAGAQRNGSRLLVARARLLEGRSYHNQGQPGPAEASLQAARQVFTEAGDKAGVASSLNSLAALFNDRNDLTATRRMYEQSLAISEEIGDRRGMSAALNNLGILLKDQRRFEEARAAHERALALRKEIGDRNWTAVSLSNIGVVLFEQDRLRQAASYYKESLAICRQIGDTRGQVRALHNLAIVDRELGRLSAARVGYEESLATRASIGDKRGIVMGRVELGTVLLAQGEIELARSTQEGALRQAREARLRPGEAQALFQLGQIDVAVGDLAAARGHHEQALALRKELKETRTIAESQAALAALAFEEGLPDEAERQATHVNQSLGGELARPLRAALLLLIARAQLARGDLDAVERTLRAARRLAEHTERIDLRVSLSMVEAEAEAAHGRTASARARIGKLRTDLARAGMALADLECRVLLLRFDRADGLPNVAAHARELEKDAQARRAGTVVHRVRMDVTRPRRDGMLR